MGEHEIAKAMIADIPPATAMLARRRHNRRRLKISRSVSD